MKYSNLKAFEKHLASSVPDHLSEIYVIISKEPFERKVASDRIVFHVLNGHVEVGVNCFHYSSEDVKTLWSELEALNFFASKKALILSQGDKLSKEEIEKLRKYFSRPNPSICLILQASAINRATNFYKDAEKYGIILDVPEEKPWEKEKSILNWLMEQVSTEGKIISGATASLMIKQLGTDQTTLQQEIAKLITYIGERHEITNEDFSALCAIIPQENIWQLGEAIFMRDAHKAMSITKGLIQGGAVLIALLRQIRSQIQTDYQVCCLLSLGKTPQDISLQFPYMKGNVLNKHIQQAQSYGLKRFKTALLAVDETELNVKNSAGDPEWLVERLILKLTA